MTSSPTTFCSVWTARWSSLTSDSARSWRPTVTSARRWSARPTGWHPKSSRGMLLFQLFIVCVSYSNSGFFGFFPGSSGPNFLQISVGWSSYCTRVIPYCTIITIIIVIINNNQVYIVYIYIYHHTVVTSEALAAGRISVQFIVWPSCRHSYIQHAQAISVCFSW